MSANLQACEDFLLRQEDARLRESEAVQDLMDEEGLTEEEAWERYEDGEAEREAMEAEWEAEARRDGVLVVGRKGETAKNFLTIKQHNYENPRRTFVQKWKW